MAAGDAVKVGLERGQERGGIGVDMGGLQGEAAGGGEGLGVGAGVDAVEGAGGVVPEDGLEMGGLVFYGGESVGGREIGWDGGGVFDEEEDAVGGGGVGEVGEEARPGGGSGVVEIVEQRGDYVRG